MMISSFYVLMLYFFSLILFFNFNSPIFFWLLMEINLISFMMVLYLNNNYTSKQNSMNYILFYFLIQSTASILFLSNFSFMNWFSIFNYDIMFIMSLIFKIGLFPLFFWIFSFSEFLNLLPLILLLSFQKIPLLCGLYFSNSYVMLTFIFLSFAFGSIMLFYSNNLLHMFLCSSISYSFLMFFLYTSSIFLFLTFFSMYSIFLFFCLFFKKEQLNTKKLFITIASYSFFLGVPPLGLFFYKFIFLGSLFSTTGLMELFLFWIFSVLSLFGYLKFFYFSFFLSSSLYFKSQSFLMNHLFFCFLMCSYFLLIF